MLIRTLERYLQLQAEPFDTDEFRQVQGAVRIIASALELSGSAAAGSTGLLSGNASEVEMVRKCIARIKDEALEMQFLGLHPWVQDGARRAWQSGMFDEAVLAAWKSVNQEVRVKAQRLDLSDEVLITQVLSPNGSTTGSFLWVKNELATQTDKDRQRGMMMLGQAVVAGLRNVVAHDVEMLASKSEVAMECLVTMSLLANWLDSAVVKEMLPPKDGAKKKIESAAPPPPPPSPAAWSLRHHRGDIYILENVGTGTARNVRIDSGDLVARMEPMYDCVPPANELTIALIATMGTVNDRITVTWNDDEGDGKRWERVKPPKY